MIFNLKKKHINSSFDEFSYCGLKYLQYTFGDLDDYWKPILLKESSGGNYQMYSSRGDKDRNMYITEHLDEIIPHLIALIDEKRKSSSHKIQLDISVNLIHLT